MTYTVSVSPRVRFWYCGNLSPNVALKRTTKTSSGIIFKKVLVAYKVTVPHQNKITVSYGACEEPSLIGWLRSNGLLQHLHSMAMASVFVIHPEVLPERVRGEVRKLSLAIFETKIKIAKRVVHLV